MHVIFFFTPFAVACKNLLIRYFIRYNHTLCNALVSVCLGSQQCDACVDALVLQSCFNVVLFAITLSLDRMCIGVALCAHAYVYVRLSERARVCTHVLVRHECVFESL